MHAPRRDQGSTESDQESSPALFQAQENSRAGRLLAMFAESTAVRDPVRPTVRCGPHSFQCGTGLFARARDGGRGCLADGDSDAPGCGTGTGSVETTAFSG